MKKKLNLLFVLVFVVSMITLTGCGGSGKAGEKSPYEGKWAVSYTHLDVYKRQMWSAC